MAPNIGQFIVERDESGEIHEGTGKEVHVRFAKEEAQTIFFFLQFQFLPSISFGLRHHFLRTGLLSGLY